MKLADIEALPKAEDRIDAVTKFLQLGDTAMQDARNIRAAAVQYLRATGMTWADLVARTGCSEQHLRREIDRISVKGG